jgi:SNF2 family DNA or RNA helicase
MGLGKTLTTIGLMFVNIVSRTLIIVPPILVAQWAKELYRITGHQALIYYGNNKKKISIESILKARIVIVSYHAISISKKIKKLGLLHKIKWDRVIFDEAHHLRNRSTIRFLGAKNLQSPIFWLLTGTPIQNKKKDLFNLCDVIGLHKLKDFNVNNTELYLLRRTKKMAGIILPEMTPIRHNVTWKNQEEKLLAEEIHSTLGFSGVCLDKGGNFTKDMLKGGRLLFYLRAKQICIMSSLLNLALKRVTKNENKIKYELLLKNSCSSKLDEVIHIILERKTNGKGKIIFCHYRDEINYLENKLTEKGLVVIVLDGRCTGKTRINKLALKVDILILQIQTGCEGLNLQENYSEVYFVSPHWNPSIEDQAIARCHRIGQQKTVQVFRFEMEGFDEKSKSLEKYIGDVQLNKRIISSEFICT